ncbi:MAG: 16S rRNA (uracil(1498)-N(3))-methyltransferase [Lentisphaerae bacterium]|jgi:RsmE family RNA methyltransferase|nr:16S rRNA (uracil(1498)-N(3))-methyltransferase [Lentisphaerota bacterium]
MNRILASAGEVADNEYVELRDERFVHIRDVLQARTGDSVRIGILNGLRFDDAHIVSIDADCCVIKLGSGIAPLPSINIDLLLALPRPKCMKRLWPQLTATGAGRIFIVNAEKVEPNYWGAQILKREAYMPLVIEGLSQSGDTAVPEIVIERRLKPLLEDKIGHDYNDGCKLLANPGSPHLSANGSNAGIGNMRNNRLIVGVGPEGGWSKYELDMFEQNGFRLFGFGERILRTDTACIALITHVQTLFRR